MLFVRPVCEVGALWPPRLQIRCLLFVLFAKSILIFIQFTKSVLILRSMLSVLFAKPVIFVRNYPNCGVGASVVKSVLLVRSRPRL